jgi:hypothetical protein
MLWDRQASQRTLSSPKVVELLDSLVRRVELEPVLEVGSTLEVVGSQVTPYVDICCRFSSAVS